MRISIKSLLSLSLILISLSLSAQEEEIRNPKIDSLEALLNKNPSERQIIKIWDQLALQYRENDFEKAIAYAEKMIDWAEKNQDDTLWIKGYHTKGTALHALGEVKEGQKLYEQALERSKKIKDQKFIARSYGLIGRLIIQLGQIEESRKYFQDALKIFQKLELLSDIARMQNAIAVTYAAQSKYQEALASFQEVLKVNKKLNNLSNLQANYFNIGSLYFEIDDDIKGIEAHQEALEIAKKLGDRQSVAESYNMIAAGYQNQSNFVRALDNYQKSLKISQNLKDQRLIATTYGHIGVIYGYRSDNQKKLEYDKKALEIYKKIGEKSGQAHTYYSIGRAYASLKDYDQAIEHEQKALEITLETGELNLTANAYYELANVYLALKQYEKAFEFLKKTKEISEELMDKGIDFKIHFLLGEIYLATQKLNQTIQAGEQAYQLAQYLDTHRDYRITANLLFRAYEQQGNYEKALFYHKIYKARTDSSVNAEEVKKFTTLENEYKFAQEKALAQVEQEKKELELANTIQRQKNLRNAFIVGFILVLLSAFFILRSYLIKRKANINLAEKNEVISLQAEELKVTNETLEELGRFKQEMTGMLVHDLKNPLNSIIGLTETPYQAQHYEAIRNSGQNMLNLVNNILDVQRFEEAKITLQISRVNLKGLFTSAYHQVAYLFKEKNIQFKLEVHEDYNLDLDEELIKRVLINLLHNAGKYTPNNGHVSLIADNIKSDASPQMKIQVIDNGIGIAPEQLTTVFNKYSQAEMPADIRAQSTGLGLTFCKLVVEAHEGEIDVESKEGQGSTFYFTLPIRNTENQPIEEFSTKKTTAISTNQLELSPEEKQILTPFVEKIREHEVFEVTPIKAILKSMEGSNSESLSQWKKALEDSMYAGNEERFKDLLDMI